VPNSIFRCIQRFFAYPPKQSRLEYLTITTARITQKSIRVTNKAVLQRQPLNKTKSADYAFGRIVWATRWTPFVWGKVVGRIAADVAGCFSIRTDASGYTSSCDNGSCESVDAMGFEGVVVAYIRSLVTHWQWPNVAYDLSHQLGGQWHDFTWSASKSCHNGLLSILFKEHYSLTTISLLGMDWLRLAISNPIANKALQ